MAGEGRAQSECQCVQFLQLSESNFKIIFFLDGFAGVGASFVISGIYGLDQGGSKNLMEHPGSNFLFR